MTQRLITLGAVLSIAASSMAQAAPLPSASATVAKSAPGQSAATAWVDPPAKMAAKQAVTALAAPTTQGMAALGEPAASAPAPEPVVQAPATSEPRIIARQAAPAARVPAVQRQAAKPRVVRTARYAGGEGGAWRTARDSFGFAGSFGGCRFTGFAGPNGYRLNRVC